MIRVIELSKATVTGFELIVCVCVSGEKARSDSSGHHFLSILFIPFSSYVLLSFSKSLVHNSHILNCAQCYVRTVGEVDLCTSCDQCYHLWIYFRCVITCRLSKFARVYRHVVHCFVYHNNRVSSTFSLSELLCKMCKYFMFWSIFKGRVFLLCDVKKIF
jgi:hypothetical protein